MGPHSHVLSGRAATEARTRAKVSTKGELGLTRPTNKESQLQQGDTFSDSGTGELQLTLGDLYILHFIISKKRVLILPGYLLLGIHT